jgi:hypothetical protein
MLKMWYREIIVSILLLGRSPMGLILVYGAAEDEYKHEFQAELVRICEVETLPILVEGNFNIL